MKADLLLRIKLTDKDGDLREIVVWRVRMGLKYPEGVRYRMAFIPKGLQQPAVLYDNHHPKGHHKHIDGIEISYLFLDVPRLISDFEKDILRWKKNKGQD